MSADYTVTVAIPTFRRPAGVVDAIRSVQAQTAALNADAAAAVSARILIIDNDPGASARSVVAPFGVDYVHEPRPGIAAVRNRALAESSRQSAIVFLDDDEIATEGWLRTLLEVHRATGATAVAGRVLTEIPTGTPPWVPASGAFVRPTRTDGQLMAEAASNNLLLDVAAVQRLALHFDEAFGLTGGSDSMFTRQLTARGGSIRWAQHAVVMENEAPERFSRSWVLMRAFRFGNTGSRVSLALARRGLPRALSRARMMAAGLLRIAAGGARVGWGVISASLSHRAAGTRTVYRGAGMLSGAVGVAFNEYGRRRKLMGVDAA